MVFSCSLYLPHHDYFSSHGEAFPGMCVKAKWARNMHTSVNKRIDNAFVGQRKRAGPFVRVGQRRGIEKMDASFLLGSMVSSNEPPPLVGLGLKLSKVHGGPRGGDQTMIADVVNGGGAQAAGLFIGDSVLQIDGADTKGMGQDDLTSFLLGPAGQPSELLVVSPGQRPRQVVVQRQPRPPTSKFETRRKEATVDPLASMSSHPSSRPPAQDPSSSGDFQLWEFMDALLRGETGARQTIQARLRVFPSDVEGELLRGVFSTAEQLMDDLKKSREAEKKLEVRVSDAEESGRQALNQAEAVHQEQVDRLHGDIDALQKLLDTDRKRHLRRASTLEDEVNMLRGELKKPWTPRVLEPAEQAALKAEGTPRTHAVHVSKAEAESLHHQLEEQMEAVTKLKAQIEEMEYLKELCAERGEEAERLTSELAVVKEREDQALRELDLSQRALEAERQQGMTARDSARAEDESESANRKRTAKEVMIGKLQSRVVTLESDRTHILRENEAAVYEIGRLSSLLGDQAVEIERLHQVVSDLEAKHKVQMQRVGEASERWRLKRDEAVRSIDSLRAEVEKKDATISKHRRLLEEYQQILEVMNEAGGPTRALNPVTLHKANQ